MVSGLDPSSHDLSKITYASRLKHPQILVYRLSKQWSQTVHSPVLTVPDTLPGLSFIIMVRRSPRKLGSIGSVRCAQDKESCIRGSII